MVTINQISQGVSTSSVIQTISDTINYYDGTGGLNGTSPATATIKLNEILAQYKQNGIGIKESAVSTMEKINNLSLGLQEGYGLFNQYVSVTGDDGRNGLSPETAKQSIADSISLLSNGQSLGLKRRDVILFGDSSDMTKPISIGAYLGGASPVVSGGEAFVGTFSAFTDSYGPEYLTNGDFAAWSGTYPDGWQGTLTTGTITKDTTTFGNNAVRFANNTSGTNSIRRNTTTVFRPGPTYTFSADIVATVGQVAGFRISNTDGTYYLDEDGVWYEGLRNHTTAPYVSGVLHHSVDFTVPDDLGDIRITTIVIQNQVAGRFIVYDSVSFLGPIVSAQPDTWSSLSADEVFTVRVAGDIYRRGTSQFELEDEEWFWASGVLYIRRAAGAPDGLVEISGKNYALRSLGYPLTVSNVSFRDYAAYCTIVGNTSGSSGPGDGSEFSQCNYENINRQDNPGTIRINRSVGVGVRSCYFRRLITEAVFGFEASYWAIEGNILEGADGGLTDGFQMSYSDETSVVPVPSYGRFIGNKIDMRGARNGKGCTMFIRGSHDTFEDNTLLGSGWGLALNADYVTASNNLAAFQEGPFRASGLRIAYPMSFVAHTLLNWVVCNSYYGVNIQLSSESGITPTGNEHVEQFYMANWAIAGCSVEGFSALPDMPVSGSIVDSIFYNPAASGADLRVTVGAGGLSVSNCCFGPARVAQFVVNGVSYDSLDALEAASIPGFTIQGCISADPQFVDAGNLNFTLSALSPCIGAATDGGDIGPRGEILTRAFDDPWVAGRLGVSSGWDSVS